MYSLFLDDERMPYSSNKDVKSAFGVTKDSIYYTENWEVVRTYEEFITYVGANGIPSRISFDYDLHKAEVKNGLDALQWILSKCIELNVKFPEIYFHTANNEGRAAMMNLLELVSKNIVSQNN